MRPLAMRLRGAARPTTACSSALLLLLWATSAAALSREEFAALVVARSPEAELVRAERAAAEAQVVGRGLWGNPEISWQREALGGSSREAQDIFALTLPLDVSGRLGLRRDAAELQREAAGHREHEARRALWHAALQAFDAVLAARTQHEIVARSLVQLDELSRVIGARERVGEAAGYDRLRVDIERAEVTDELAEAAQALFAAERAAATLLGTPDQPLPPLTGELAKAAAALPPAGGGDALLSALEREARAAALEAQAAGRAWVPTLRLTAGAQLAGAAERQLGYVAGVELALPLFDRGQGEDERGRAAERLAELTRARVAQQRAAALEVALAAHASMVARVAAHEARVLAASVAVREAALAGYRGGATDLLALLDAEALTRRAERRAIELRLALSASKSRVEQLLGLGGPPTP